MQNEARIVVVAVSVAILMAAATGSAAYFRRRAEGFRRENEATLIKMRALERKLEELQNVRNEPSSSPGIATRAQRTVTTDEAQLATLQSRITELEAALLERDRLIASLQNRTTNRAPRGFGPPGGQGRDRSSWLDDLRRIDPQRYEEITRGREEMRQRVSESFAKKATHFLAQETKNMSEEQKAQYERLVQLLNESWALSEQLRTDPPAEVRANIFRTLGQNMEELGPLLEAERQREFMDLALRVGYKPDQAQEFVAYLNQIIEATSLRSLFPGMRGGPRGFGFRGNNGGRERDPAGRERTPESAPRGATIDR